MNVLAQQFWTDPKVQSLGVTGKLLFAAIITDDRVNLPGLYAAGPEHFYHSMLPAPAEDVQSAFNRLLETGMAQFDPDHRVLRLPNVWKYAPAPNPNQVGSWKMSWLKTPDCPLRYEHILTLRELAYKGLSGSKAAFDAMFGQIVPGDHRTYSLGRTFLSDAAKARKAAKDSSARDPSGNLLNTHTNKVFVLESREGDQPDPEIPTGRRVRDPAEPTAQAGRTKTLTNTNTDTITNTITGGFDRVGEGLGNGSDRVPKALGNGSDRVSKGLAQVSDIATVRSRLTLLDPHPEQKNAQPREDQVDDFSYPENEEG